MRLSHLLATAGSLTVIAIAPSAAHAAFGVTALTATPGSTQAGAHADFSLDMSFAAGDDVRDLVIHLPKGFVGNPQAATVCTQAQFASDKCPAGAQVGTTTVTATVTPSGMLPAVTQTQAVSGQVFNLQPRGAEPARLGVLLPATSTAGGLVTTQPIRLQSVATVRTNGDYGLDSTMANLPRTVDSNVGTLTSHIDRIQLTLRSRAPGASLPFLTNPTTCNPATTSVDAVSYAGARGSNASAFTPTGCDAVPYDPKVTATLDGAGVRQHPQLTTVVSQEANEATSSRVVVTLPSGIGPNLAALSNPCTSDAFQSGDCPDSAKVGSGTAITPLLADPLTGPVYLVEAPGGGLPQLGIALSGLLPVKLRASVSVGAGTRLVSTLDGLPDVPLSSFKLVLDGGDNGLLVSGQDLCAGQPTVDAVFTSQSGIQRTATAPATATNCSADSSGSGPTGGGGVKKRRPKVTARLSKAGTLVVVARVPKGASKLRRVKVSLPKGLKADAGKRLRAKRAKGARKIKLRVGAKHLTRTTLSKKAKVTVVARTAAGRTYKVRAKVRR
jgi:hypothetical protein